MGRRGQFRDHIRDQSRNDLPDLLEDRMRSREDLRDLIANRLEKRALVPELQSERPRNRGHMADHESNRFESGEENAGGAAGIDREELSDLILDRIRNRGDVDQLLEQIHDRIEGEE